MTNIAIKTILFVARAFVKSLLKISHVCATTAQIGFLLLKYLIRMDITGCQDIAKIGIKQMTMDFHHTIDDVEQFMWCALGLNKNFLSKENADRFASLNLLALLISCARAFLKNLVY